jgi:hypothetical protein
VTLDIWTLVEEEQWNWSLQCEIVDCIYVVMDR